MTLTLDELAQKIGATVAGDPAATVSSAHTLEEAGSGQVSFLSNVKYEKLLSSTRATAVIVSPAVQCPGVNLLRAKDPYFAFMQAVVILHGHRKHPHPGIHPEAHIDPSASIGPGTIIYPGAYVGPRAKLGRDCILYPNSVVYDDCILGDRVILHAGAVIGQDGFGYATHKGEHHKIPQAGNVILEEDVEVGANVAIQRATMGSTVIGKGTKLSDLISVGHAARVGPHGLIVSLAGIAGSTKIGHHVMIGGQAGIIGHLTIGDHVHIAAQAGVVNDVADKSVMMGSPATPAPNGRKGMMLITQLPDLLERIRQLERQVAQIMERADSTDKS